MLLSKFTLVSLEHIKIVRKQDFQITFTDIVSTSELNTTGISQAQFLSAVYRYFAGLQRLSMGVLRFRLSLNSALFESGLEI